MSNYTILIDTLIKNEFDFDLLEYPIFNEEYRELLNTKILEHFRFREIGFETPFLFKHFLNKKMNEVMPYYNKLYNADLLFFNPLYNIDVTTESTRTAEGESEASGTNTNEATTANTGNSKNVYSDTPQGLLSIGNISGNVYATNADIAQTDSTTTENASLSNAIASTQSTKETFINRVFGNNGSASNSKLIMEFRESIINIDMQVISELNELFMGVY